MIIVILSISLILFILINIVIVAIIINPKEKIIENKKESSCIFFVDHKYCSTYGKPYSPCDYLYDNIKCPWYEK